MTRDVKGLQFVVQFDEQPREELNYQVAIFDANQKPVYQEQVKGREFSIPFDAESLRGKRIFLFPFHEERKVDVSFDRTENSSAYEVVIPLKTDVSQPVTITIPRYIWIWWPFCRCHVRGRVFNWCGHQYLPVAKARVHVCEVDPVIWYIQKLPDLEVIKLRDEILGAIIDWHLPDPPPDDTRIKVPVLDKRLRNTAARQIAPSLANPVKFKEFSAAEINQSSVIAASLPKENLTSFYSSSAYLVRNYMIQQYKFFYPYWCRIKSIFLRCDEVAVLETDNAGWFDGDIWYYCFGDKPDLYFWVEYLIDGVWTTVYKPWIGCNTHWDYTCNTEVDIYLNDQRIPCPSWPTVPGNKIVVTTLGNNVNVNRVDQAAGANQGLAPDLSYGAGIGPFLGSVEPHVFFGEGLIPSGISYYRWRFKSHAAPDIDANWKSLNQSVDRYYFHESPDSFLSYNLGPKAYQPGTTTPLVNADLFEIQTANVPAAGVNTWFILNARTDTATAYFNTLALNTVDSAGHVTDYADGLYDLKLEFFDATGAQVNLTTLGTTLEVPDAFVAAPFTPPLVSLVPAPADYQLLDGGGNLMGFKMTIRVDNNPTYAEIHETTVGANTAGPCGMMPYVDKVLDTAHIAFQAFHPNDFAYFNFSITRGSSGSVHAVGGNVSNVPPIAGYAYDNNTDQFDTDLNVSALLGDCDEAAFAEVLNVYAAATDGWSRTGYDSGDVKAFALTH